MCEASAKRPRSVLQHERLRLQHERLRLSLFPLTLIKQPLSRGNSFYFVRLIREHFWANVTDPGKYNTYQIELKSKNKISDCQS